MQNVIEVNGIKYVRLSEVKRIAGMLAVLAGGGVAMREQAAAPKPAPKKRRRGERGPGRGAYGTALQTTVAAVRAGAKTAQEVASAAE